MSVDVTGEGSDLPRDESHLVVRCVPRGLDDLGVGRRPGARGTTPSRTAAGSARRPRRSSPGWSPPGRSPGRERTRLAAAARDRDRGPSRQRRGRDPRRLRDGVRRASTARGGRGSGASDLAVAVSPEPSVETRAARGCCPDGPARRRRGGRRPGRAAGPRGRRRTAAARRHAGLAAPALPRAGDARGVRADGPAAGRRVRRGDQRGGPHGRRARRAAELALRAGLDAAAEGSRHPCVGPRAGAQAALADCDVIEAGSATGDVFYSLKPTQPVPFSRDVLPPADVNRVGIPLTNRVRSRSADRSGATRQSQPRRHSRPPDTRCVGGPTTREPLRGTDHPRPW